MSPGLTTFVGTFLGRLDGRPLVPVAICLAAAAAHRLWFGSRSWKGLVWLGVACAAAIFRDAFLTYCLAMAAAYGVVTGLDRLEWAGGAARARRWRLALAAIAALAVTFVLGRHLAVTASGRGGPRWLFPLDMWTALRLVTLFWEAGSGRVRRPGPARFATWAFLPFTLGGPVVRYSELEPQLTSAAAGGPSRAQLPARFWRRSLGSATWLLTGLLLTPLGHALAASAPAQLAPIAKGMNALGFGPWSFFLSSMGTFRLMEAGASLCGLAIPESYDRPFGRRNLSEFWANWNMTATRVFRDYLFLNRWGLRRPNLYLNSLIVFSTVGLWHGSNSYWIGWGLLHGCGFAAHLWLKRRRLGPSIPRERAALEVVSALATYGFVCACWYLPSKALAWLGRT